MENFESHQTNQGYTVAQKNWQEKGYLGVTANDHEVIGSTPDKILIENPDKTLGELMTDDEITEYIIGMQKNIIENENLQHHNPENWRKYNSDLKQNLEVTIKYLKSIDKLPEDFKLDDTI